VSVCFCSPHFHFIVYQLCALTLDNRSLSILSMIDDRSISLFFAREFDQGSLFNWNLVLRSIMIGLHLVIVLHVVQASKKYSQLTIYPHTHRDTHTRVYTNAFIIYTWICITMKSPLIWAQIQYKGLAGPCLILHLVGLSFLTMPVVLHLNDTIEYVLESWKDPIKSLSSLTSIVIGISLTNNEQTQLNMSKSHSLGHDVSSWRFTNFHFNLGWVFSTSHQRNFSLKFWNFDLM